MEDVTVVILCGGRGRRLGEQGAFKPKALAPVFGQPIIWYLLLALHRAGFRHFLLPLGHLGAQIQAYIDHELTFFDARIDGINTGPDTSISKRIQLVSHLVQGEDFLLINGDTICAFDYQNLIERHKESDCALTLCSSPIVSQYGLIITEDDRVVDFTRDSLVGEFSLVDNSARKGFVNAGVSVIKQSTLSEINLSTSENFEQDLFSMLAASGRARHHVIDGYWFAVDTQKDLDVVNDRKSKDPRAMGAVRLHQELMQYAMTMSASG